MGLLLLRLLPFGEEYSIWERWLLQYKEWLSTGILAAVPSVPFPEPPYPDSPQVSLVHSALPLPELRVSIYKQNFVHWPFKRLSVSLAISPWHTETLLLFTAACYLCFFPALVPWAGVPSLRFRLHISQGNPRPWPAEISLWNFSCHPGSLASPLAPSPHSLRVSL